MKKVLQFNGEQYPYKESKFAQYAEMIADEFENSLEDEFDDMLNESGSIEILGMLYSPSHVLSEVDPIAYRTAYLDFRNGLVDDLANDMDSDTFDFGNEEFEWEEIELDSEQLLERLKDLQVYPPDYSFDFAVYSDGSIICSDIHSQSQYSKFPQQDLEFWSMVHPLLTQEAIAQELEIPVSELTEEQLEEYLNRTFEICEEAVDNLAELFGEWTDGTHMPPETYNYEWIE